MAKPNYRHAKRQKELAKKTKQQAKQQRRSGRVETTASSEPGSENAFQHAEKNPSRGRNQ